MIAGSIIGVLRKDRLKPTAKASMLVAMDKISRILKLEEKLNFLEERAREKYGESLTEYGLADLAGLAILDFILFCERAGDHYTNIAQSIIGGGVWHGETDLT